MSVQLLSGRNGQLAALCLRPVSADPADFAVSPGLSALAGTFPCLIRESDLPALGEAAFAALANAGCHPVDDHQIALPANPGEFAALGDVRYVGGDWYLQPLAVAIKDQTGSRTLALKLLQLVVAEAETREIEEIFRREPTLSYHLMRLVNSPAIGTGRRIDSFAQAIMVLGRRQLRRWLNLLQFTARKDDPRASMLLARVTVRARLLEMLAHEIGEDRDGQERAFMVGMFSMLGQTFGMPLAEVLKPLALDPDVVAALLQREGDLGRLLSAVEAHEVGDVAQVRELLSDRLPGELALDVMTLDACTWMLSLVADQGASHG